MKFAHHAVCFFASEGHLLIYETIKVKLMPSPGWQIAGLHGGGSG